MAVIRTAPGAVSYTHLGKLEAVGYDKNGKECCRAELQTAGKPEQIKLSVIQSPKGWKADGADMVLLQVEVMDKDDRRCPLANHLIISNIRLCEKVNTVRA